MTDQKATATERVSAFLNAAGAQFGSHDSDIARQISAALGISDPGPLKLPPNPHPAGASLIGDPKDKLTGLLNSCAADLHWRTAGFGKLPEGAERKIAVVELAGPAGMFRRQDVRFGLLIQREWFQYPKHWHAAEELYYVIAGAALWAVDDEDLISRAPGCFIHHRSMQPHRMVTEAEPLLALWGWVGDIAGSSYSI